MRVYDGPWKQVRKLVLARDRYLCQLKRPGCTHAASQVDHIIEPDQGGSWYDPRNLQAACRACNASKGGEHGNHKRWGGKPSRDW